MPGLPAEYIQETQEEDARVSRVMGLFSPAVDNDVIVPPSLHHRPLNAVRTASPLKAGGGMGLSNGSLDVRSFSPFNPALGHGAGVNGGGGGVGVSLLTVFGFSFCFFLFVR